MTNASECDRAAAFVRGGDRFVVFDRSVETGDWGVQLNVRVYTADFNRVVVKFQPTTETRLPPPFFCQFGLANSRGRIERKKTTKTSLLG